MVSQLEQSSRRAPTGNFAIEPTDTAMIAVQGPQALETLQPLFDQPLEPFRYYHLTMGRLLGRLERGDQPDRIHGRGWVRADCRGTRRRSEVWNALLESGKPHGIAACGLGARDTLRLEAGMPLYGHELSESINPYAAGVAWAVKLDKGEFVGREALERFKKPAPNARDRAHARGQADRQAGECRVLPANEKSAW